MQINTAATYSHSSMREKTGYHFSISLLDIIIVNCFLLYIFLQARALGRLMLHKEFRLLLSSQIFGKHVKPSSVIFRKKRWYQRKATVIWYNKVYKVLELPPPVFSHKNHAKVRLRRKECESCRLKLRRGKERTAGTYFSLFL